MARPPRPTHADPDLVYPPWFPNRATDAIAFTLYGLSVLMTALRLYTRGVVLHALGVDDVLITIATVSCQLSMALCLGLCSRT